jgi:hypothetical protein
MKIEPGTKVTIDGHWNWPNSCSGTVEEPPESVRELVVEDCPWDSTSRTVKGKKGPIEFVWVKFETPQRDGDGDGPYWGGEVERLYVKIAT